MSADLTEKRFDRLVAKYRIDSKLRGKTKRVLWHCVCDCGNEIDVYSDCLQSGTTKSCGCLNLERDIPDNLKVDFVENTQISKIKEIKLTKSNKSGVVGVNWDKSRSKWQASIRFQGCKYNLGRFDNIDDAIKIRKTAEKEKFGEFLKWYENNRKEE